MEKLEKPENFEEIKEVIRTFELFTRSNWRNRTMWGLKPSEIKVLLSIHELSTAADHRATVSEISKMLYVTSPTVTQIVKSLEQHRCVERIADQKDRRFTFITLTDKGKVVTNKAKRYYWELYKGFVDHLGKEKSDMLVTLLHETFHYFEAAYSQDDYNHE